MYSQRRTGNPFMALDLPNQSSNAMSNELVDKYDKKMLQWLVNFHGALNKDQINIDEVSNLLELLKHISSEDADKYIFSLLYPESSYAKIPTPFPVPTSEVRDHLTFTLTTSSPDSTLNFPGGNFAFVYNPFYVCDLANTTNATFYLNTNASMAGTSANDNFVCRDIGQSSLPAGMYSSYRLVSASVTVNYIGRMDIVSGTIGCGVGFNSVAPIGTVGTSKAQDAAVYCNFNLIDDSYFSQRTQSINGLRMIYFPLDSTYSNFYRMGTGCNGFYFVCYGQGLPASSACIRLDIYLNYEFTVNPAYSSYVAQSPGCCGDTGQAINGATSLIQRNPGLVSQPSGETGKNNVSSSGWLMKFLGGAVKAIDNLGSVGKVLPGIGTLRNVLGYGGMLVKGYQQLTGQNNRNQENSNETALARPGDL